MTVELEDTAVDLEYAPLDHPWIPANGAPMLDLEGRRLTWIVPIPRARVRGTATLGELRARFDGLGYQDFVQTDIPPWRLPLRELVWGRALATDLLVIWNSARFRGGSDADTVTRGLIRTGTDHAREAGELELEVECWQPHDPTGDRYPDEWAILMGRRGEELVKVQLGETRLLLGDRVADVQRFGNGLERWIYRTVTGDPVEYKLFSKVSVGGTGVTAGAAHERVIWGRRRGT